jgi:hypothetical protein
MSACEEKRQKRGYRPCGGGLELFMVVETRRLAKRRSTALVLWKRHNIKPCKGGVA